MKNKNSQMVLEKLIANLPLKARQQTLKDDAKYIYLKILNTLAVHARFPKHEEMMQQISHARLFSILAELQQLDLISAWTEPHKSLLNKG